MNSKAWLKYWFLMFILAIPFLVGINYVVDPLNILHTKFFKEEYQMNERFMKIEFLENNNRNYNSYMFGSSRIGTTYPSDIEKYIPNSKFYNLTIGSGNFNDYITHLEFFINRKYPISNLYLQIDIGNMGYFGNSHMGYLGKYHPLITNESLDIFYLNYLTSVFPMSIIGKIKRNIFNTDKKYQYFLDTTGVIVKDSLEKQIEEDCAKYVKNTPSFNKNYERILSKNFINETILSLQKINKICNDNSINLFVFTTPHHKKMMDTYKSDDYFTFIQRIGETVSFYDFSGYNTVTSNDCNYYEHSHYRPKVGRLIAARIFNDTSINVPEDFGIKVTNKNLYNHLIMLKKQFKIREHEIKAKIAH